MIPFNRLDATQVRAIEEISTRPDSDHLVAGFAGSGKTIVLTHVLENLSTRADVGSICFATFTHALKDMVSSGLTKRTRRRVEITTFDTLRTHDKVYDLLIADELQDIPSRRIRSIEGRYRNIVAAADFSQRIYRSAAKVHEIESLISGATEHSLGEIHRINDNIFQIALTVCPDAAPSRGAPVRDDDEKARYYDAPTKSDECITVYEEARRQATPGFPSAVLFPSRRMIADFVAELARSQRWGTPPALEQNVLEAVGPFDGMNRFLDEHRTDLQVFGSGSGEMDRSDERGVVYLMTYHSSKGLDFPNVFLPHLNAETSLEPMKGARDDEERRLFFVAATRARRRLYLSHHGPAHRLLDEIPWDLVEIFRKPRRTY